MSILNMLEGALGSGALQQISERVGLPTDQLQSVINSLGPRILPQLQQQAANGQLAGVTPVDEMPQAGTDEAEEHGNTILGSILGSKAASSSAAAQTAAETGVDADKVEQVLPQLASIAAAAFGSGQASGAGGLGAILSNL